MQITTTTWQSIKPTLATLNPTLAELIETLPTPNQHPFYKVTYPADSLIADKGTLNLPNENGELFAIFDPIIKKDTQKALGYLQGFVPYGIVLDRAVEIFSTLEDGEYMTQDVLYPGDILCHFTPNNIKRAQLSIANTAQCEVLFFPRAWFESNLLAYHEFQIFIGKTSDLIPVLSHDHSAANQTGHLMGKSA